MLYKFNDWIESMEGEKLLIRHTAKTKDDFSLKTTESTDRQFLIEKLIQNIKFKYHYQNSTEKPPEITETIESNYKVNRRVYQSFFFFFFFFRILQKIYLSTYICLIRIKYKNLTMILK